MDDSDIQKMADFAKDIYPRKTHRELVWWGDDYMQVPHFQFAPQVAKAVQRMFDGAAVGDVAPLLKAPFPRCEFLLPVGVIFGLWDEEGERGCRVKGYDTRTGIGGRDLWFQVREDGALVVRTADGMASAEEAREVGVFCKYLAYLNCPKLLTTRTEEYSRQNRKLAKLKRPARANRTVVEPSQEMIRYLAGARPESAECGTTLHHPVRGHWRVVWCGPKDQPQRPEPRWIAPFTRGNPEHGTKTASYLVKGNDDA
jgi:hypothetical protein